MLTHDAAPLPVRGRPPRPEPVVAARGLRLHHLALLRAVVHGMSLVDAAKRYLPEQHDVRTVRSRLQSVAQDAGAHLVGLGEPGLAEAWANALQLDPAEADGRSQADPHSAAVAPSLEDFAAQFDLDMYTERELQELYEQEYGVEAAPTTPAAILPRQADLMESALRGLGLVQSRCAQAPRADDPASMWLSKRLCGQLEPFGVQQLGDVVTLINGHGRTWWRAVPGLGRDRAGRLVQWLLDHEEYLGVRLSARVTGLTRLAVDSGPGVVQNLPTLRAAGVNALGADTDAQAVQAWLDTLTLKSTHTREAYQRDVGRLLLWARERGKSLTTLVVSDAVEHARFLLDPPAHWVNPLPTVRASVDWRPMRGPLSISSANRALAAIGHLYGFLMETGYLVANPFARVRSVAGTVKHSVKLDTTRTFSSDHMALIEATLNDMPDDLVRRRLIAILVLAETTGLRIGEMAGLTWGDLRVLPGEHEAQVFGLRVLRKGARESEVPLRTAVVAALGRHRADRKILEASGVVASLPDEQVPLLSIIERTPGGEHVAGAGHLSKAGIHNVLTRFFRAVARRADDERLRADFERASCHWLRHTFAHEVLRATGNDLPVTQQLLDHRSIATTGIYLKADMSQRVQAVLALQDRYQ